MTDEFQKALADIPESWCDDFNHEGLPCFGAHLATIHRALKIASALSNPKTYEQRCVRDQILKEVDDGK